MKFEMPSFVYPDFSDVKFANKKEISCLRVEQDGVAPDNYFLTTHMPTFYYYKDKWILPEHNSLNCVAVLENEDIVIKELRALKTGELVVTGRSRDGSEGIFVYKEGFSESVFYTPGKAAETSFSEYYNFLFEQLKYERDNGGYIVWVLGPSVVFDYDTRVSLNKLTEEGFVDCVLAGNAMATHDLEGGFLQTSLGQNIYTQENMPMGHYNHLDLLNEVRDVGSIKKFIEEGYVKDGLMKTLIEMEIPYVLAGSIRDDGPLPEVYGNMDEALDEIKSHLNKSTLIIGLATLLHNVSTATMASSYRIRKNGTITPVYMYAIDLTENITNKIGAAREYMACVPLITNVQDFVVNCERALIESRGEVK